MLGKRLDLSLSLTSALEMLPGRRHAAAQLGASMHPASLGTATPALSSLQAPYGPWAPGFCWRHCKSPELTHSPREGGGGTKSGD